MRKVMAMCLNPMLRAVHLPSVPPPGTWKHGVVKHAGWVASLLVLLFVRYYCDASHAVQTAALITLVEAVYTDMLGGKRKGLEGSGWFLCGNFGVVVIAGVWNAGKEALDVLERMVQVTMMRGAQSGGVVTYVKSGAGVEGVRARVVNSKRTDLSQLVRAKIESVEPKGKRLAGPRFYAGHTRFATTSKATFDGTHPHQWTPRKTMSVYVGFDKVDVPIVKKNVNVEHYICHNGDLDFFTVGGRTYDLGAIQQWLQRCTGAPMPSPVDSVAVAGCVDLLRTQGSWPLSVRYAFLIVPERSTLLTTVPSWADYEAVGEIFENAFLSAGQLTPKTGKGGDVRTKVAAEAGRQLEKGVGGERLAWFRKAGGLDIEGGLHSLCLAVVDAFYDNDIFHTVTDFLSRAKGSFGLCINSSLDAEKQLVVAARGQTISVAVYPRTGIVCWGSEQAAVKAAMGVKAGGKSDESLGPAIRLDLDDLGGEACLVDWGKGEPTVSAPMQLNNRRCDIEVLGGIVRLISRKEALASAPLLRRSIQLDDNPLVLSIPDLDKPYPVAEDISRIPQICRDVQESFRSSEGTINQLTMLHWRRALGKRLKLKNKRHDEVDILITGAEVSLWMGEQFASDLTTCFKGLNVKTMSANKLLGLFGQGMPIPQTGHQLSEGLLALNHTIVLIVSHSGGTFASLAVSNLLQSVTTDIFVVASEWDTQIGKQLRTLPCHLAESRIFSTGVGVSPAEPCTISVAATHQLLTEILLFTQMYILSDKDRRVSAKCVATQDAMAQLARMDMENIKALEEITGYASDGTKRSASNNVTNDTLVAQGKYWADHVLEAPRAWICVALYVVGTVTAGWPVGAGLIHLAGGNLDQAEIKYPVGFIDSIIYLFFFQLAVAGIRLLQGRPLWHRMAGRSVVIGDVPWVAQCVEAFFSKMVATTYSITGVAVYSGNPVDHLVHKYTHRVVRGGLLAVGRPDGRLCRHTSSESAVLLSSSQASSIQNMGATCETLTLGHNPYKLGLAAHNIVLPTHRPKYLCEKLLEEDAKSRGETVPPDASSGALHGMYDNLFSKDAKKEPKTVFELFAAFGNGVYDVIGDAEETAKMKCPLSEPQIAELFHAYDADESGTLDWMEFNLLYTKAKSSLGLMTNVNAKISATSMPTISHEDVFGDKMRKGAPNSSLADMVGAQNISMELYESRCASFQRCIAFIVLFHAMGESIAAFWRTIVPFEVFAYRADRTHSIMRIATTASPVSGADVRLIMKKLKLKAQWYDSLKQLGSLTEKIRTKATIREMSREKLVQSPKTGTPKLVENRLGFLY
ncbi:glutamine amidotransferase type 2 domain-containing protein [Pycnococcus provasolii]